MYRLIAGLTKIRFTALLSAAAASRLACAAPQVALSTFRLTTNPGALSLSRSTPVGRVARVMNQMSASSPFWWLACPPSNQQQPLCRAAAVRGKGREVVQERGVAKEPATRGAHDRIAGAVERQRLGPLQAPRAVEADRRSGTGKRIGDSRPLREQGLVGRGLRHGRGRTHERGKRDQGDRFRHCGRILPSRLREAAKACGTLTCNCPRRSELDPQRAAEPLRERFVASGEPPSPQQRMRVDHHHNRWRGPRLRPAPRHGRPVRAGPSRVCDREVPVLRKRGVLPP